MDTIEKIKKITDSLLLADEDLSTILAKAGQDSETQYTERYLDLLLDLDAMQEALHKLLWGDNYCKHCGKPLDDFLDTWKEVDYAAGGFMPTNYAHGQPALDATADKLPSENEMKKGKINMVNYAEKVVMGNIPLPEVKK